MKEIIKPYITEEQVKERVKQLADNILKDIEGDSLTLICILRGAVMLMVDLAKAMDFNVEMDFMEISSYGSDTKSSGVVKIIKDISQPITGKNVVLVEDIIDTGRTLANVYDHLLAQKPKSLKICTLLDKAECRIEKSCTVDYIGFEIPDAFVVGYGLDYAQKYRNLPYIGILSFEE